MSRRVARVRGEPKIPVIDLFAGPGGLSEGFSALGADGSPSRFRISLSIEKDPVAHSTLLLRAAYRHFPPGEVPEDYYAFLRGEISRETLLSAPSMKQAAAAAAKEAWCAELGVTPAESIAARVRTAVADGNESVLIGGPPCQAYSLAGRSRNRGKPNYRPEDDNRHVLYREYLRVIGTHWPAVFVMENVKGLLSSRLSGETIFTRILEDLHDPAKALKGGATRGRKRYAIVALSDDENARAGLTNGAWMEPTRYVVRSERYGIPQARHRLFLLGIREDIARRMWVPALSPDIPVGARDVLGGLPPVRSGLSRMSDSLSDWRKLLKSKLDSQWFKRLRHEDPRVHSLIGKAVEQAQRRRLDRGREFIPASLKLGAHVSWYRDERLGGVLHHTSRSHMAGDIARYLYAACFARAHGRSPVLADFPYELLPEHRNVRSALAGSMFQDRFRVQLAEKPATTITSHIAKDGHYYIHFDPAQCRSLTVREAARLQTFPDNYYFSGGRTAQYHQIGNAVPPLLARQIAALVSRLLG